MKLIESTEEMSDEHLKEKIVLNGDNNRNNNGVDVSNGKFSISVIKAVAKKKRMKRTLSDSVEKMEEVEDGLKVSKKRLIDVENHERQNNVDQSSSSFLHSNKHKKRKSVGSSPHSNFKKIQDNGIIHNNGVNRLSEDKDINSDSPRLPSLDNEVHDTDINGNGECANSDSNCKDGIEDVKFTVGPSRQRHHRIRSIRRSLNTGGNSHQNSSAYSSTNGTKTFVKPPIYQKIDKECYVAVDCEMVGVGPGGIRSALGRCSIVDYNGAVLYDKFVQCEEPITDYRTIYSGITPKHMKTAEPLEKAKQEIHNCLKNKVLVAHDIINDFIAMDYSVHRYLVRDTSRCHMLYGIAKQNGYNGQEKNLISLKSLVKTVLGKDIQVGKKGHDSVEDARATMELFRRVRNGWEKMLFAKWSVAEGQNVLDLVNGLNNKVDVRDAAGIRITDFRSEGGGESQHEQDYLSDDFWPVV